MGSVDAGIEKARIKERQKERGAEILSIQEEKNSIAMGLITWLLDSRRTGAFQRVRRHPRNMTSCSLEWGKARYCPTT